MQTADGGGRFCEHCQKTVVDYSTMSDVAVVRHVADHGLGCGRFQLEQLERKLVDVRRNGGRLSQTAWMTAGIAAFVTLLSRDAGATSKTNTLLHIGQQDKEAGTIPDSVEGNTAVLEGRILDANGELLKNTPVIIKSSTGKVLGTTSTDEHGNYSISIQNRRGRVTLVVNYQGRHDEYSGITLIPGQHIQLDVSFVSYVMGRIEHTDTSTKKTFWQKLRFW